MKFKKIMVTLLTMLLTWAIISGCFTMDINVVSYPQPRYISYLRFDGYYNYSKRSGRDSRSSGYWGTYSGVRSYLNYPRYSGYYSERFYFQWP